MGANTSAGATSDLLSNELSKVTEVFEQLLSPRVEWWNAMESSPASAKAADQDTCSDRDAAELHCQTTLRFMDRSAVQDRVPVKLVVFDFDETLTLASYFPTSKHPSSKQMKRCAEMSFEDAEKRRIRCLSEMLSALARDREGEPRALAVLTKNRKGLRPVLAMMQAAGLDSHFSAMWCWPPASSLQGAYRAADGSWQFFVPEVTMDGDEKADVVHSLVEQPETWFPQFRDLADERFEGLRPEHVALVDDSSENFESCRSGRRVLRCCEVARYQMECPNLGAVTWGGIGARSEADYNALRSFIRAPWNFRQ